MSTPSALSTLRTVRSRVHLIHCGLHHSFGCMGEVALDAMRDELLSYLEAEILLLPVEVQASEPSAGGGK
jgi:hypothetical protein